MLNKIANYLLKESCKNKPCAEWIRWMDRIRDIYANNKKMPADKCDSYTRMLQMNPPKIIINRLQ